MGLLELRQDQRAAQAKNERAGEAFVFASKFIKCSRCGLVPKQPSNFFYKRVDSPVYAGQDERICVCKECAGKIFDDYCSEYGDTIKGLIRFCADFNYYFDKEYGMSLLHSGDFSLGKYIQYINRQRKGYTFANNYLQYVDSAPKTSTASGTPVYNRMSSWTIEDKKNRDNVISKVGYDPYGDGSYSDEQLRSLYNTTTGYLTDDQDPHKVQNIVLMCKTFLQLDEIDRMITTQLLSPNPDANLISSLTGIKKNMNDAAIKIANENGFAEKTSGKSTQGSNTLSKKMEDMYKANFSLSKVNIHDVEMAESFTEIAKLSSHALIEEMNMTGDDYARLCADQREFVVELQSKLDNLEEENRLCNIKIKDLEAQLRAK